MGIDSRLDSSELCKTQQWGENLLLKYPSPEQPLTLPPTHASMGCSISNRDAVKRGTHLLKHVQQISYQTGKVSPRGRPLQSCSSRRRPALLRRSNPIDPGTGNLVAGDIKVQTDRALKNVDAILRIRGSHSQMS